METLKAEHKGLYFALVKIEKYLPGDKAPTKLIDDILRRIQDIAEVRQKMSNDKTK